MLTSQKIKLIKSLGLKKNRVKHGLFAVEGEKCVGEFIDSGWGIEALYATDQWSGVGAVRISEKELERISFLKSPNKVLALIKINSQLIDVQGEIVIALDGVSDPGNLGTIIRLADWFGVKHICCSSNVVDCFNPKVVQATMGSLSRVHLHYGNLKDMLTSLDDYELFCTVLDGPPTGTLRNFNKKVIVFGNESHGVSAEIQAICSYTVSIPKHVESKAESLNVAVACGICLSNSFSITVR